MMTKRYSTYSAFVLTILLCLSSQLIAGDSVVISEIMFNPDGDENAREYVEVLNLSDGPLALAGYVIGDGEGFDQIVTVEDFSIIIAPGGYGLILDPDYFEGADLYEIPPDVPCFTVSDRAIGSRGLSNSTAETVSLVSAAGDTLSQVTYDITCPPGHSWERVLPDGGDSISNYKPSIPVNGTPGRENSVLPPVHDPALDSLSIRIDSAEPVYNEPLAVSISYCNAGREPTTDVTITMHVSTGSGFETDIPSGEVFFSETVMPGNRSPAKTVIIDALPGGFLTIAAVVTTGNSVTAPNDTLQVPLSVPIPAGTILLNEVMAAPSSDEAEWIEVINSGNAPVSLASWLVCDCSGSHTEPLKPMNFLPGNGYAIITGSGIKPVIPTETLVIAAISFPSLNNDGDTVKIVDWNGTDADSMQYSKTVSGYSLELIAPYLSGTSEGWDVCVNDTGSTPGRRNSIAYPPVAVENGERVRSELTTTPNPFGERTNVSYMLPFPLARVRLRVYDRRGRLVAILRDTHESGSEWSGEWDGRSSNGDRLPAGPYILHLEALDKQSGTVQNEREVIVIGSRL